MKITKQIQCTYETSLVPSGICVTTAQTEKSTILPIKETQVCIYYTVLEVDEISQIIGTNAHTQVHTALKCFEVLKLRSGILE